LTCLTCKYLAVKRGRPYCGHGNSVISVGAVRRRRRKEKDADYCETFPDDRLKGLNVFPRFLALSGPWRPFPTICTAEVIDELEKLIEKGHQALTESETERRQFLIDQSLDYVRMERLYERQLFVWTLYARSFFRANHGYAFGAGM
jgi:hypothetical protein